VACDIVPTADTERAADHFPLVAEFEVDRAEFAGNNRSLATNLKAKLAGKRVRPLKAHTARV
jgi:hypothetical protein